MSKKTATLFILMSLTLILAACGSKEYKVALEEGYDNLEIQAYKEANSNFSKAIEHKKTDEAQKGLEVAETMESGWAAFDEGDWDVAIDAATSVIEDGSDDQAVKIVLDDAKQLAENAEALSDLQNDIVEKFELADDLADDGDYEDAKELFEVIIVTETDHPVIVAIIDQAKERLAEIEELIEKQNEQADKEDEPEVDDNDGNDDATNDDDDEASGNENDANDDDVSGGDDSNNGSSTSGLSEDEATSILRNELQIPAEVIVNVDHVDGDYYVIQVYEVVGSGEGSHTATWGWYKMHKVTGDWEDMM